MKLIDDARRLLGKDINKLGQLAVSHFLVKDRGANNHFTYCNAACYANLRYTGRHEKEEVRVLINQYQRPAYKDQQHMFKEYYSYMFNRSIFKSVFLNGKNGLWKKNGLNINLNLSPSFVMGGMTAVRECTEFGVEAWYLFTKEHGFTEDEAFLLASFYSWNPQKKTFVSMGKGGHGLFNQGTLTVKGVKNFLKHKVAQQEAHNCKQRFASWKVNELFNPTIGNEDLFLPKLTPFTKSKGGGWDAYKELDMSKMDELKAMLKGIVK